MLRPRHQRGFTFRLYGWLALLLYLPASVGVAVPLSAGKDLSTPFPCMHRQCGCQNADECWRGCCCFTLSQRIAWARSNNLTPPSFVDQTTTSESAADALAACPAEQQAAENADLSVDFTSEAHSCCSKLAAPQLRDALQHGVPHQDPSDEHACTAQVATATSSSKSCCDHSDAPAVKRQSSTAGAICTLQAFKCRGVAESWLGLAPSVVTPPMHWSHRSSVIGAVCHASKPHTSAHFSPPSPPPWA